MAWMEGGFSHHLTASTRHWPPICPSTAVFNRCFLWDRPSYDTHAGPPREFEQEKASRARSRGRAFPASPGGTPNQDTLPTRNLRTDFDAASPLDPASTPTAARGAVRRRARSTILLNYHPVSRRPPTPRPRCAAHSDGSVQRRSHDPWPTSETEMSRRPAEHHLTGTCCLRMTIAILKQAGTQPPSAAYSNTQPRYAPFCSGVAVCSDLGANAITALLAEY
ncbi:hypothetical protein B0H21DRAFT_706115 [Amylocystis lapponica]|nr:hypothetical protein B0H21DRAFT_706115 [Amylocystis lapponica]